jgi:hypothetical protein
VEDLKEHESASNPIEQHYGIGSER